MKVYDIVAWLYERFYHSNPFSEFVYNEKLYGWALLIGFLITLLIVLIYYYVINSPRWNSKIHWFIVLIFNTILNFIILFPLSKYILKDIKDGNDQYLEFTNGNYMGLCWSQTIIVLILFALFSVIAKYKSSNCSCTPF